MSPTDRGRVSSPTRRSTLRGIGLGLLGGQTLPAVAAEPAAGRSRTQTQFEVTDVEVGQITLTGNWDKRTEIENNTSDGYFDVKVAVDGCEPSSEGVQLVYNAAAISTTENTIVDVQGDAFSEDTTNRSVTIVHGNRATHAFRTGLPAVEWTDGHYEVQVAVADINQQAYAGGVSQSFTIR
jgi:hypothetical protein